MQTQILQRLLPAFLFVSFQASAGSIGVYVSVADIYAGSANYATGPGITVYSNGGLNTDLTQYDRFSSTVTQPGATTAGLTISSNVSAVTQESSTAYSSLGSGIMRSTVNTLASSYSRATTDQIMNDTATFTVSNAPSAQIQVIAHLSGIVTGVGLNAGQEANEEQFSFGGSFIWSAYVSNNGSSGFGHNGASGYTPPYGWDSYQFTNESVTGFDFVGLYTVTNGQTVGLRSDLSLDCSAGATCDFSNTSRFSLVLPSNVSFTSGSGVLLTQVPSATPEPGTLALALPGLALAALAWRRKKA